MWGEEGVERSARTVDSHIWRLRRLLEPERDSGAAPTVLVREPAGYRLVVESGRIDSVRFATLAAEAAERLAAGRADQALKCAEEAAELWRGRPYGTAADKPWARPAVARLLEIRGRLRETHVAALLGTDAADRALAHLETALDEEPLRERLWAYRIVAYRDSGRRSEALATYADARAVLVDELGVEPGPELRALHAALLRDDDSSEQTPNPRVAGRRGPSARPPTPPRSRLVGRDVALGELLDALAPGSLVTLTGAAGCGKTRLALEAADRAAPRFPDGVCFIDLTSATPERVLDVVCSMVELPLSGSDDPADALRRYLAARRTLVVLDNCEHVLDAVAELVDTIFTGASDDHADQVGFAALTTSREPLEVDGEHIQFVDPLSTAAAMELFAERLDVPVPDETVVAEIVAAVDGLPLAIELAAGRARVFSLVEIAQQVRADASTLSRLGRGGRRSGGAHHRTVRDAIDSSYRGLPAPLARLHRALSAVPGPFTAGLATGLVDADATDTVAGLAHRSLLAPLGPAAPGGASRFMQLATVRGHARHEAGRAGENPGVARNVWVEGLVRARPALGSARHAGWYRALDDDLAAVRATLQQTVVEAPSAAGLAIAARLGVYWTFGGMGVEGGRWLRSAVDACAGGTGPGRAADRAAVQIDLGALRFVEGRPEEGRTLVRAGIAAAAGVSGEDAVLVCTSLAVTAGAVARAADAPVLAEVATAARRIAAGSAALDVIVRHVELVHATIRAPSTELVPRYLALHHDARAEDNLYTAWLAAANAARLMLAAGQQVDAVVWARNAVQASAEAGLRSNPYALEVYGAALGRIGRHAEALHVFGAVEEQHRGAGVVWPWDPSVIGLISSMRAQVGAAAAERARAQGSRATLREIAAV